MMRVFVTFMECEEHASRSVDDLYILEVMSGCTRSTTKILNYEKGDRIRISSLRGQNKQHQQVKQVNQKALTSYPSCNGVASSRWMLFYAEPP